MPVPSDNLDRKIYNILNYGSKRQAEIVNILKSDRSKKTVHNHLTYLSENSDWIEKSKNESGNAVYYSHKSGPKEPFRPKPKADPDIVDANFYNIERRLGLFSQQPGIRSSPDTFSNNINELLELSLYHKDILYNEEMAVRFFDIFDVLIEELLSLDVEEMVDTPSRPYYTYRRFFELVKELYYNWENGQGYENYHPKLKGRLDGLEHNLLEIPKELRVQFQEVALIVNVDLGKEYYKYLVGSGDHEERILLEKGFYTYDCRNDINEFIDDMENVSSVEKYQDSNYDPAKLVSEVSRLYKSDL